MLIAGSCHCGNISFQLRWLPEPTRITARSCTCTFCTKHGGVWTSCPEGELTVSIRDPARWSRYTFRTKTAEFHDALLWKLQGHSIDESLLATVLARPASAVRKLG